jgi:predicted dehydrogenase
VLEPLAELAKVTMATPSTWRTREFRILNLLLSQTLIQMGGRQLAERTGAEQSYADYREMLEKADLDLVSVGPRWVDCHAEMVIACAEAGVKGIFCEKPFAKTLPEADAMIDACDRNGVKIAVAHRRASGYEQYAKKLVEGGEIGEIQVMRGHGKDDHRAGAMDLMVLGTHILDSMRYFAGPDSSGRLDM